jgi:outer membrane biosynthesis protein TonB
VTASFADNEIWHVMIASDEMKRMNVEQLDDAFRLSLVDASTMVWKAGMKTWQRLGAVAGLDEEEPEDSVTRLRRAPVPPPPPRPIARPAPKPPSPSRAPVPQAFNTAVTPVYRTQALVAPVFTPQLLAPDPYVLPKRRAAIASDVDFRRGSKGVRWGRWLVALLLLTGGVLGAYRQNLLREGARRVGIENKYLAGERRVTAYVSAKSPPAVKAALTRLALLPGPNALPPPVTAPAAAAPAIASVSSMETETKAKAEPSKPSEPEVKTVSLDSLPVLTTEEAKPEPKAVATKPKALVAKAKPQPEPVAKPTPKATKPKAEPVAKAEPEPKPKPKAAALPPSSPNDSPLKAAIRSAILADAAKK